MPELIDKSNEAQNLNQIPAPRGDNKVEWIVIHYLGVANADNEYLYGGGYGGHYYVSRAGKVYKAADPRSAVTWHCGGGLQGYAAGSATYHKICTNWNSIGIENGVCYDSDWYFTTETQESLVWLVNSLMAEYGIPKDHVIRHWDVTGKNCPAPYVANNKHNTSWTWDEFKSKLNGSGVSSGGSGKGDYVAWAVNIANDDRYYYDHSYDPFSYSCSTLVAKALYETGYFSRDIVPPDGSAIGGEGDSTLHNELRASGFVEMPYSQCGGFRRGDIFTIDPYHIAIYVGDGQCVAANGGGATKADDILVYSAATFTNYVTVFRHPEYAQGSAGSSSSSGSPVSFGGMSPGGLLSPTPLYTTSSTRADAMMREVCYLGKDGEPSINKTDIKLSVLNYTDLLSEFYGLFGFTPSTSVGSGYAATETTVDNIDRLKPVHRDIVKFLQEKGFNTAAAIGIVANIEDENKCSLSAIKNNIEFGLCRWTWSRAERMKAYCKGKWKSSLTGQLEYMVSELETAYKGTLENLKKVENTLDGAKKAMRIFYNGYIRRDKPKGTSRQFDYKVREDIISKLWSNVIIGQTIYQYSYGGMTIDDDKTRYSVTKNPISSENAKIVGRTAVKTVVVPSILGGPYPEQSGIIGDTTRFDYFFDRWSYTCRIIADRWHAQGRPSNHHVCMLDGYYLVAVAPMFGTTGDLIEIILEDGTTLNCICGDTKGSDRQSDYGHVFSGMVSIVEWESCNIQTDNEGAEMNQYLKEWGIHKKKVRQITNYGVYIS